MNKDISIEFDVGQWVPLELSKALVEPKVG